MGIDYSLVDVQNRIRHEIASRNNCKETIVIAIASLPPIEELIQIKQNRLDKKVYYDTSDIDVGGCNSPSQPFSTCTSMKKPQRRSSSCSSGNTSSC